jgi:hypothetical protein
VDFQLTAACPGKFCIGDTVSGYNTAGLGLNLRQCASTNNANCPVVVNVPDGTRFTVFGGPVVADGYTWWGLQGVVNGVTGTGWAADLWLTK